MSRKREKPYSSRHIPYSYPKRRRPLPPHPIDDPPSEKPAPPPALLVMGLPTGCSVLDLKARFEIYGPISRIRIDHQALGFVSFRSKSSADSALAASLDPSFGISIDSHPVQLMWANERNGGEAAIDGEGRETRNSISTSSKLLKGETPLSRHGRLKNRLSSAIVSPNNNSTSSNNSNSSVLDSPFKAREIIAYDDIL